MKKDRALFLLLIAIFLFVSISSSERGPGRTTQASSAESLIRAAADSAPVFSVKAFGAKGDGKALDTPAINRAIDAATAVGGGTVWFTAGTYRSFSIHLKSNIALYLDQGATIVAADP